MNKLTFIVLLAICAIAVAHWTWIDEEEEVRPALTAKNVYEDEPHVATALAAVPVLAVTPRCTGCTQYGTPSCNAQTKVCYKRCLAYGSITCPAGNTLAYNNEEEDAEYTYGLDYKPEDYITNLAVVAGDEGQKCPDGYTKIWTDLNKQAGGKWVFLCYIKELGKTPVVDITVVKSGSRLYENSCPAGYTFIDVDLNQGAGGKYMYFCYKKTDSGTPLVAVSFALGKNAGCPSGYRRDGNDLNEGAGGDYVYLCHLYDPNAIEEIILSNFKYDLSKLQESDTAIKSVDSIEVDNPTSTSAAGPTLSGSFSVTTTKSWSSTNSIAVGIKLTAKTGVPATGWETSIELSTTYTYSTTTGGSIAETNTKSYSIPCTADAMTITRCDAQYRQATLDVPYSADALFRYRSGTTANKSFAGVYKGVSVSAIRMKKTIVYNYKK